MASNFKKQCRKLSSESFISFTGLFKVFMHGTREKDHKEMHSCPQINFIYAQENVLPIFTKNKITSTYQSLQAEVSFLNSGLDFSYCYILSKQTVRVNLESCIFLRSLCKGSFLYTKDGVCLQATPAMVIFEWCGGDQKLYCFLVFTKCRF